MTETQTPAVEVRDLVKTFKRRDGKTLTAVDHVSFSIAPGETLALIGESGSGKSTTGRLILGLEKPDSGEVFFRGDSLATKSGVEVRKLRAELTVVFQEPFESLNPRLRIHDIVAEPLIVQGVDRDERNEKARQALYRVGLSPDLSRRYPSELSGGQQQRVGIARAIVAEPKAIVLDEPTASLDRTIRANVAAVLDELQQELDLAYLLITHDIGTVRRVSARSAVMLNGGIVEIGPTEKITTDPDHEYTRRLISAELPLVVPDTRKGHVPFERGDAL